MTDWALQQVWLIPLIPLLCAAAIAMLKKEARRPAAALAVGGIGLSFLLSLLVLARTFGPAPAGPEHSGPAAAAAHEPGHHGPAPGAGHAGAEASPHGTAFRSVSLFAWFTSGRHDVYIGFLVDPIAATMLVVVSLVSLLVFIYSIGYMAEDWNFTRFYCFLSFFAAAMLGLVISNSLLMLFMCWELVGLASYLLIGFWFHKPSANAAAKKAFIVTRVGDIGLLLGLLLLYQQSGSLVFHQAGGSGPGIFDQAELFSRPVTFLGCSATLATLAVLLLFVGAAGKSAQFPLHVWLPDAMEGPTSVSALIHAATMVAAGVFLMGRMFPLLEASPAAQMVISHIGGFTALFAATIAVAQNDIKRVLAYSTISQLGYMMLGLGVGGFVAGMFHLTTHAFFKALLFLASGSVILGCHHEQDMLNMGGLRARMPVTFATYFVGTLALAGLFPFAGFFSKDEILLAASHFGARLPLVLAMAAAALTSFYMFRQIFLVFFGEQRDPHYHPRESPRTMTLPLVGLALLALGAGWVGTPWRNLFHHYVAPGMAAHPFRLDIAAGSTMLALLGIAAAYLLYGRRPLAAGQGDPLAARLGPVHSLLRNKYYIDELYQQTLVRLAAAGAAVAGFVDRHIIDAALHALGRASLFVASFDQWVDNFFINGGFDRLCDFVRGAGTGLSRAMNARSQHYLRFVVAGLLLLLLIYHRLVS